MMSVLINLTLLGAFMTELAFIGAIGFGVYVVVKILKAIFKDLFD